MSTKELERYRVLTAISERQITQVAGAKLLNLSTRQIRTLVKRLQAYGPEELISKRRGKESNRSYDPKVKHRVLEIIAQNYDDFGPTLVAEKLLERHQIKLSKETLRQWMSGVNIWIPKQKKRNKHRLRTRRDCFGELIQIDGSHHDWFGTGKKCVLIVFIDDATSTITSLYFAEGESLEAYFSALEKHLNKFGRPKAFYSDRLKVFESDKDNSLTQFKHALKNLEIDHITAMTPQAKGRVERVNKTLQDRFIKEMRLRNIKTIEDGNRYLEEYIKAHNKKFSKEPVSTFDAHRPLEIDLSRILCRYEERTLLNDLSVYFHNKRYQISEVLPKRAKIEVRLQRNGILRLFFKNRELNYEIFEEQEAKKECIKLEWKDKTKRTVGDKHPWKSPRLRKHLNELGVAR